MLEFVKQNNLASLHYNETQQISLARIRSYFYANDIIAIEAVLQSDLKTYKDEWDAEVVIVNIVQSFLEKLAQAHKKRCIIQLKEGTSDTQALRFNTLMEEVDVYSKLLEISKLTRYHGTVLPAVKYVKSLDMMWIDTTYNVGTTKVIPYSDFELEPNIVIRQISLDDTNDGKTEKWIIFDRKNKTHSFSNSEPKISNGKIISPQKEINNNIYFPFIVYRWADVGYDFWQIGFDELVFLNRNINILQSANVRDNVKDSIRIVTIMGKLLNPETTAKSAGPNRFVKKDNWENFQPVNMQNPVRLKSDSDGKIGITISSPSLFTDDFLKNVEALSDQFANLHGVDPILGAKISKDLSGVAIKLRSEGLLRGWQKEINILKKPDLALIKKIVEINNYHRPKNKIGDIIEFINYQNVGLVTNEKTDYELARMQVEDGVLTFGEWLMQQNPGEMSLEEAEAKVIKNKAITEPGLTIEEEIEIEE